MQKVLLVAGGIVVGFVLAVALSRVLLTGNNDTTIKLAETAPAIPAALTESQPLATKDAAGTTVAPAPQQQTAPVETTQPAAPAAAAPVETPPAAPAPPPYLHFVSQPAQSKSTMIATQGSIMGDSLIYIYGSNVTGDFYLTPEGALVEGKPSTFQLDLRTMTSSDKSMVDQVKATMEVTKFPMAEFVAHSASGIPATFTNGNEFTFTMTGPLNMHGRSKITTFRVKARQQGDFFTYAADGDFLMTDYGWTPPNYGVAWAKNSVHLQMQVVARRADNVQQVRSNAPVQPAAGQPAVVTSAAPTESPVQGPSNSGSPATVQGPSNSGSPATMQAPATLLPQAPAGEAPAAAAGGQPAGGGLPSLAGGLSSLTNLLPGAANLPALTDIVKLFNAEEWIKMLMPGAAR